MDCCHRDSLDKLFDNKRAQNDLKEYQKKGPSKTTHLLIEGLIGEGIADKTLLDIGGGIGAIQHELIKAGAYHAVGVDASNAYLAIARAEAERQNHADQVTHHYGDFVELAPDLEPTDVVTLDRSICCYPDMPALVGKSSTLAQQLYGLVYPRDVWWIKVIAKFLNSYFWLTRDPYRFFVHAAEEVDAIVRTNGFKQVSRRQTPLWQVVIYAR
ncbi:MAG: class I SAM-dependent methyltransferase [Chloroflexota bacterium]